jgi:hypothetical protein
MIDTSLHQNAAVIKEILDDTLGFTLSEAFLESAPQLILQCTAILRDGNLSMTKQEVDCLYSY